MKVLVVDDCSATRSILNQYLVEWGHHPVDAEDGVTALRILAEDDAPRMMIIDWMMPRMDGPELIKQIRTNNPGRPSYIIMLTAKTTNDALVSAFEFGVDDYLAKPINADELFGRLKEGENILSRQDEVGQTMDKIRLESN